MLNELSKEQAKPLSVAERSELLTFLAELDIEDDPNRVAAIRRRMEDREPGNWIDVRKLVNA